LSPSFWSWPWHRWLAAIAHVPFAHAPFARSLLLICHCSFTIHCSPLLGSHPLFIIHRSSLIAHN
jgi:hypothetical protein